MVDVDEVSRQLAEIKLSLILDRKVPALRAESLVDFHAGTDDFAPVDYEIYLDEDANGCLCTITKYRDRFEITEKIALKARERVVGFTVLRIGEQLKDINFKVAV